MRNVELERMIDAQWEMTGDGEPRHYLGASLMGHECERYIWLNYRHAVNDSVVGRMQRLFNAGHMEEAVFVRSLEMIGCTLSGTLDNQTWLDLSVHVGGHPDGYIESGLPGYEHERLIVEFKTHNDRSFSELVKNGVYNAKIQHYVQMQAYMHGSSLEHALYMAVNKNTSEYYTEIIEHDAQFASSYIERAEYIATSDRMPDGISTDPTFFKCRMCPYRTLCHEEKICRGIHCKTCANFRTRLDSKCGICALFEKEVPFANEFGTYECHVCHPDLIPCEQLSSGVEGNIYKTQLGRTVLNGYGGMKSGEFIADLINERQEWMQKVLEEEQRRRGWQNQF